MRCHSPLRCSAPPPTASSAELRHEADQVRQILSSAVPSPTLSPTSSPSALAVISRHFRSFFAASTQLSASPSPKYAARAEAFCLTPPASRLRLLPSALDRASSSPSPLARVFLGIRLRLLLASSSPSAFASSSHLPAHALTCASSKTESELNQPKSFFPRAASTSSHLRMAVPHGLGTIKHLAAGEERARSVMSGW